jgi:hypothetical protein
MKRFNESIILQSGKMPLNTKEPCLIRGRVPVKEA